MLDMLNRDAVDVLLEAINAKNPSLKVPLTKHNVTVSPVTVLDPATNEGMDAEVTITAVKDGPFVGYLKFQYARAELSDAYGADIKLDLSGIATLGSPYGTKIKHAFGAESMPFTNELELTIPTVSTDFKPYETSAYSNDAAMSHIWKSATPHQLVHCRIMPNGTLRVKSYDLSTKVPAEIKADDWSYGNGRAIAFHGGNLYIASAFDGSVVIKTPTADGVDFTTGEYKVYFMETSAPILVSSNFELYKVDGLTFDTDGAVAVTVMSKDSGSITPNAALFNTMIPIHRRYNSATTLISPEHMECIAINHNAGTFVIKAVEGEGLTGGDVLICRKLLDCDGDAGFLTFASNGHSYHYHVESNTFKIYSGSYATDHPDHVWYDFYVYGGTCFILGVKDDQYALYELYAPRWDFKGVYDFNIPNLDPSIKLRVSGNYNTGSDHISITYATALNTVVSTYNRTTSEVGDVINLIEVDSITASKNTYTVYQNTIEPKSQAMISDDGKLVAVDLSEDHELTGNKTK